MAFTAGNHHHLGAGQRPADIAAVGRHGARLLREFAVLGEDLGRAEAICDLVSTGSTLLANKLREGETILESHAVILQTPVSRQVLQASQGRIFLPA